MWHLQPTVLTGRAFTLGGSFDGRDEPQVIAQVHLRTDGLAFVHATMARSDQWASVGLWRELARKLHLDYGVTVIEFEHKGHARRVDVERPGLL